MIIIDDDDDDGESDGLNDGFDVAEIAEENKKEEEVIHFTSYL